jgi:hypothetical protein
LCIAHTLESRFQLSAVITFRHIDGPANGADASVIESHAVFVDALASDVSGGGGTVLDARYTWDFGGPNGAGAISTATPDQYSAPAYNANRLTGWNAAHVYSAPGQYRITLTVTDKAGTAFTAQKQVSVKPSERQDIYVEERSNWGD